MILLCIRVLFFLCILMFYAFFLREKWKIQLEFTYAIVCCSISTVLFVAGILNMMLPCAIIVTLGAPIAVVYTYKKYGAVSFSTHEKVVCFVWLFLSVYFAFLIRGQHFLMWDNFSHWATVVKTMLLTNRMPNFQDELVSFQAYPLGSSLFIYFVCKIIGNTDACYLYGQIILLLSFILPLLVFAHKDNVFYNFGIAFFLICIFMRGIPILNLQADSLLALVGVTLFCLVDFEASTEEPQMDKLTYLMLPLYIFLVQLKNSGVFFCAVSWFYLYIKLRPRCNFMHYRLKFIIIDILVPILSFYLWIKHIALVYSSAATSPHAMTLTNSKNFFLQKSSSDILYILRKLLMQLRDTHSLHCVFLIIITIIPLVLIINSFFLKNKQNACSHIKGLFGIYIIYFVYMLLLFATYVCSMSLREARELASFTRYSLTIELFLLGIVVLRLRYLKIRNLKVFIMVMLSSLLLVLFLFSRTPYHMKKYKTKIQTFLTKQDYTTSDRYKLQQLLHKHKVKQGMNYLLCFPPSTYLGWQWYIQIMAQYELWSKNVISCTSDCLPNYLKSYKNYLETGCKKVQLLNYLKKNHKDYLDALGYGMEARILNYSLKSNEYYLIIFEQDVNSKKCLKSIGLNQYATDEPVIINSIEFRRLIR